jgi:mono/diheme cytochrome c family protein
VFDVRAEIIRRMMTMVCAKAILVRIAMVAMLLAGVGILTTTASADDAATFKAKCAMCHGADGKGSAVGQKMGAHDFTSADVQKMSDAELTDVIAKGKNKMPAYAGKLQESDIKGLVAYVRQLGKGK